MPHRLPAVLLVAMLGACRGTSAPPNVADPIPGVPDAQQRTIARNEFPRQWPFTVGAGTLGCLSGAVLFRAGGITYALDDAASARGFAAVGPIHLTRQRAPGNPLARITQDRRMKIFAESIACADSGPCKQRLRDVHAVSDADLKQIDVEGRERSWPPLSPERISLAPVIDAGVKLCHPQLDAG